MMMQMKHTFSKFSTANLFKLTHSTHSKVKTHKISHEAQSPLPPAQHIPMAATTTTSLFFPNPFNSQTTNKKVTAKKNLLTLISDQDRGLKTQNNPSKLASIVTAIDAMAEFGVGKVTTGDSLSGTWRLLWTTEKEQLFIVEKAGLFGTKAGDVLQVIDVRNLSLNNVITFPPDGVFFVRSNIVIASEQRVNFKFTSAVLRGKNWEIPLPPFGQGWFDTVYLDDDLRVAKDIRGDYLVVDRASYNWKE